MTRRKLSRRGLLYFLSESTRKQTNVRTAPGVKVLAVGVHRNSKLHLGDETITASSSCHSGSARTYRPRVPRRPARGSQRAAGRRRRAAGRWAARAALLAEGGAEREDEETGVFLRVAECLVLFLFLAGGWPVARTTAGTVLLIPHRNRHLKCTKRVACNTITIIIFAGAGRGTVNLSEFE